MAFLGGLLTSIGSALIPQAISWVGKKLNGSPLGNIASHLVERNPGLKTAWNQTKTAIKNQINDKVREVSGGMDLLGENSPANQLKKAQYFQQNPQQFEEYIKQKRMKGRPKPMQQEQSQQQSVQIKPKQKTKKFNPKTNKRKGRVK